MAWLIAALTLAAVVARPFRVNEAVWAVAGAVTLLATRAIGFGDAGAALARGFDVYCFLIGMMALAEFANVEGVFAWLAGIALRAAAGSRFRLFWLVYAVGVLTTALLSNDATIVVLTPAVIAALARTDVRSEPYLFACAMVANAASFVLPISNPSNLLVFDGHMPPLASWLHGLLVPSVVSIAVTFAALAVVFRRALRGLVEARDAVAPGAPAATAVLTLTLAACALVLTSSLGGPLGIATLALGTLAFFVTTARDKRRAALIVRGIAWPIVPLTAALFVVVGAIDNAGALAATQRLIMWCGHLGAPLATLSTGGALAVASNVVNNLPVALNVGETFSAARPSEHLANAALVGINLGPNLTTNGSLATILWLAILRRSGHAISPLRFLQVGTLTALPALAAALMAVRP
ncbi:MAG: SLC13 family permease [Candidatus Velthaea sp.]